MAHIIEIDYQFTPVQQLVYSGNKIIRIKSGVNFEAGNIILLDNLQIIIEDGAKLTASIYFCSKNARLEMQVGSKFAGKLISDFHQDAFSGLWQGEHVFNIAYIAETIEDFEANAEEYGAEAPQNIDEEALEQQVVLQQDLDEFLNNGYYNNDIIGEALLPMN